MQENNPAPMANSPQTTEVQSVPASTDQQPKTNNFLVILLSVLLFISVSIAGFFAFQTQKLVKELTALKNEEKVAPEAMVEPTNEPIATQSSEVDPTASWKIYTNTSSSYQIKYPSDWKVINQSVGSMGAVVADARYIEIGLGEDKSGTVGIEELQMIPPSEESNLNATKVVGNLTLRCNGKFTTDTKTWCWVKVPNLDKYLNIQVFKNTDEKMNEVLDQILSTLKFTN